MKTMTRVCAAALALAAGSFGAYKTGWFVHAAPSETQHQANDEDALRHEAAVRYRNSQNTSWRLVMTVR